MLGREMPWKVCIYVYICVHLCLYVCKYIYIYVVVVEEASDVREGDAVEGIYVYIYVHTYIYM
jgi:hypothetical protein